MPVHQRACVARVTQASTLENVEILCAKLGHDPRTIVKADGNENPYGPSEKALAAIRDITDPSKVFEISRYADSGQAELRSTLGKHMMVPSDCIVCGCGSDDIINIIFETFVESGDTIVITSPTFPMYEFDAHLCDASIVDVPLTKEWAIDVDGVIRAGADAKLICLVSPNNPTGSRVEPHVIRTLLSETKAIILVDEAYIEFSDCPSMVQDAIASDRMIIVRTLSKWGGMAGMRVGYGVTNAPFAEMLMSIKQPYNLCSVAQAAAVATVLDAKSLDTRAAEMMSERTRMASQLELLPGVSVSPSDAPFVLCCFQNFTGEQVQDLLRTRGIFTRAFGHPMLIHHLRISIMLPKENDRIIDALSAFIGERAPEPVACAPDGSHTNVTEAVLSGDCSTQTVPLEVLHAWARLLFCDVHGLSKEDCAFLIDYGIRGEAMRDASHGLVVLLDSHKELMALKDNYRAPQEVTQVGAFAVFDGSFCVAPLVLRAALDKCIELAKLHATAQVSVVHTGWIGASGTLFHDYLSRDNLIAEMWVQWHADFICAPLGRVEPRISTNPVVLGFSTTRGPVVSDFSVSFASVGKLEQLQARGELCDTSCCLDSSGLPTRDPSAVWNGGSVAFMGGDGNEHKGFGMALFGEANSILGAAASGSGAATSSKSPQSFTIKVTDVSKVCDASAYLQQMEAYMTHLDSSKSSPGAKAAYPGERSRAAYEACVKAGAIKVRSSLIKGFDGIAASYGLPALSTFATSSVQGK